MKVQRRSYRVEVPSMAMGDIAFNLLIFFVILARAQDDSHLKWQPATGSNLESSGPTKASVLIDVEGKVFFNGQQVGLAQLAPRLKETLRDVPEGHRNVLLKIHRDTHASLFEPVIEAVSEAGGELVHILEERKEEP
jgi:biopolymer transport protein ExbD